MTTPVLSYEELSQIAFYAGEAICHSDPNYALEFEKLAYPANVLALANEVIATRALLATQKPVAVVDVQSGRPDNHKFAWCLTLAAHALPDDVYNLYTHPAPSIPAEVPEPVAVVYHHLHALLRECRFALDELISKKPTLGGLLCGSTTLGNLRAELYKFRESKEDAKS